MIRHLNYNEREIAYHIEGNGPAVMLVHGFGEDSDVWRNQAAVLKEDYTLIIPDIPGSGLSAFNPALQTMDDYAACLKAILDKEEIKRITLLGHSMGGYISLAFAANYPEILNGIGLIHSTAFPDPEEKIVARRKSMAFMERNGVEAFLRQSVPNLFHDIFKEIHPEIIDELISRGTRQFTVAALCAYYESMIGRPDRSKLLSGLNQPVLFIIGRHDKAVPFEDSLKQCHLPSLSHVHILEHSAHMGMWEESALCNEAMKKFLAGINVK